MLRRPALRGLGRPPLRREQRADLARLVGEGAPVTGDGADRPEPSHGGAATGGGQVPMARLSSRSQSASGRSSAWCALGWPSVPPGVTAAGARAAEWAGAWTLGAVSASAWARRLGRAGAVRLGSERCRPAACPSSGGAALVPPETTRTVTAATSTASTTKRARRMDRRSTPPMTTDQRDDLARAAPGSDPAHT